MWEEKSKKWCFSYKQDTSNSSCSYSYSMGMVGIEWSDQEFRLYSHSDAHKTVEKLPVSLQRDGPEAECGGTFPREEHGRRTLRNYGKDGSQNLWFSVG